MGIFLEKLHKGVNFYLEEEGHQKSVSHHSLVLVLIVIVGCLIQMEVFFIFFVLSGVTSVLVSIRLDSSLGLDVDLVDAGG